ncbi:hypothetical protein, partial [Nostoc sp.]|uniref:hypothetical protein n=1 Tax=Nostoc sp. TaxID=1180 RepID=UPI002FF95109
SSLPFARRSQPGCRCHFQLVIGKQEIQFPHVCKAIAAGLWVSFPASDRQTTNPVPSPLQGEG